MTEDLKEKAKEFISKLPRVGLGLPVSDNNAFKGESRCFFDYYLDILGKEKVESIISNHGFEHSALYGLHNAAIEIKCIGKSDLMKLSGGLPKLIGFAFQFPTNCESWMIPAKHYKAELMIGKAITKPL